MSSKENDIIHHNQKAYNNIIRSKCYVCSIKCKSVNDYTLGETFDNKWFCFEHVDILYSKLNVNNTSEFWDNTQRFR